MVLLITFLYLFNSYNINVEQGSFESLIRGIRENQSEREKKLEDCLQKESEHRKNAYLNQRYNTA